MFEKAPPICSGASCVRELNPPTVYYLRVGSTAPSGRTSGARRYFASRKETSDVSRWDAGLQVSLHLADDERDVRFAFHGGAVRTIEKLVGALAGGLTFVGNPFTK